MTNNDNDSDDFKPLDPHQHVFREFMDDFSQESDRACVILGSAKIETLLRNLIEKFLVPLPTTADDLLDGDAPLSTFSARIRAAHRMGLIDDHFAKLLHIFRRLRNSFAHEITGSDLCSGAPRDRVIALAEPFYNTPFFNKMVNVIADKSERSHEDPGVLFRAVIAIFYMYLHHTSVQVRPATKDHIRSIIDIVESIQHDEAAVS